MKQGIRKLVGATSSRKAIARKFVGQISLMTVSRWIKANSLFSSHQ